MIFHSVCNIHDLKQGWEDKEEEDRFLTAKADITYTHNMHFFMDVSTMHLPSLNANLSSKMTPSWVTEIFGGENIRTLRHQRQM